MKSIDSMLGSIQTHGKVFASEHLPSKNTVNIKEIRLLYAFCIHYVHYQCVLNKQKSSKVLAMRR